MNRPLLVVLPYHAGDIEIARKLVAWITELGSCKPHSLLLCADSKVPQEQMRSLMESARPLFAHISTMICTVLENTEDAKNPYWAQNQMFLAAARQVKTNYRLDFLWLEPDAIPIYPGWLDDIAEEYEECAKRFMGSVVHQDGQPNMPKDYLNGVAVYPNDAIELFMGIESVKNGGAAWDIGSAGQVVPKSINTTLIKHYYGTKEMPPVFVEARASDAPKNHVTLDFVQPGVALFHRSKDGKLIDLLSKKRNTPKPVMTTKVGDTGSVKFSTLAVPELEESPKSPEMIYSEKELMGKVRFDEHTSPQDGKKALDDLKTSVASPKKK